MSSIFPAILAGHPACRLSIYSRYQLVYHSVSLTYFSGEFILDINYTIPLPLNLSSGNFDLTSIDNHVVKNVDVFHLFCVEYLKFIAFFSVIEEIRKYRTYPILRYQLDNPRVV